jgi:hypothetical protein
MLKLYIHGYPNQLCSNRRLEREAGRNLELIWLTGKLVADFKTRRRPARDVSEGVARLCTGVCQGFHLRVPGFPSDWTGPHARQRDVHTSTARLKVDGGRSGFLDTEVSSLLSARAHTAPNVLVSYSVWGVTGGNSIISSVQVSAAPRNGTATVGQGDAVW